MASTGFSAGGGIKQHGKQRRQAGRRDSHHRVRDPLASPGSETTTDSAGNVTAGKYNPGMRENRVVLAGRIYQAMAEACRRMGFAGVDFTPYAKGGCGGVRIACRRSKRGSRRWRNSGSEYLGGNLDERPPHSRHQ